MKKLIFFLSISTLILISCKTGKSTSSTKLKETKPVVVQEQTTKEAVAKDRSITDTNSKNDIVAAGKILFYEKTCTACHAEDKKIIGPSIKDIALVYIEKKVSLVDYLKGNFEPIVDTDPSQVAIMKVNIETTLKDATPEELQAITAYMHSIK